MSCKASLVSYIVEQLGPNVRAKAMFGEYALYQGDVLFALFCDDQLYVKQTSDGRALLADRLAEAPAYPGAKPSFLVSGEYWEDTDFLRALVVATTLELARTSKPKARPKPARKAAVTQTTAGKSAKKPSVSAAKKATTKSAKKAISKVKVAS